MKHFEDAFAGLPEALRRQRGERLRALVKAGLPRKQEEDWRYTDLSALAAKRFELAQPQRRPVVEALEGAETLAFANGHHRQGDLQRVGEIETEPPADGVAQLNAVFATTGLNLTVPAGATQAPLQLITWFGGAPQSMAHLRHRLRLERGARATLILDEQSDGSEFFATQTLELDLASGARLELYRVQRYGAATSALTRIDAHLERDSALKTVGLYGGGALVRNDININLEAAGASAELHGVLAPGAGQHLDVHTRLHHHAPNGTSREMFRNLVPERAKAVFNGKIIVHPGAQKTDSEQHVDSLLLSPGAEINAKPELQIDADDVKCAHGATCGRLDETAIYYLRSRGVPLESARNLLLYTFANEVLKRIDFEPARKLAENQLLSRMPGAPALEELL